MSTAAEPHQDHCAHHAEAVHVQHGHAVPGAGPWRLAAHSTLHCLTGCVIGELAGLAIGVELGLAAWQTIALATALSYASGIALGLVPVMRARGISLRAALKIIWVGEVISIGVMEIAMNLADYSMGGMGAKTALSWLFLRGFLVAVPAGFLAAWPVNYWLLKRNLKNCY
jgi:hypothetical protein